MRTALAFVLAAGLLIDMPAAAQQDSDNTGIGSQIETSILPRVRVVRPSSAADPTTTGDATENGTATEDTQTDLGTIDVVATPQTQVRPRTQTAPQANDPAATDERSLAATNILRVPDSESDDAKPETRWQRARARRFKLAPQTPGKLDYDTRTVPIVPIAGVETELKVGARLRQLDKMTGQTTTFDMNIGEERRVARLRLRLNACRAPEDNDTHGTMAFLQIWDTKRLDQPPAFSGWMIAESPALSSLDHPRYDVWLINCSTDSAEISAASE